MRYAGNGTDWIVPGLIALAAGFYIAQDRWMARGRLTVEAFAREQGLDFMGQDLPSDFPAELLEKLPRSLIVRNCVAGERRGERVVAFEFGEGYGKQQKWVTAAAAERVHPEKPVLLRLGDLRYDAGAWVMVVHGGVLVRRTRVVGMLKLMDKLQTTSEEEAEALKGRVKSERDLHVYPRERW
jgi:hypothetical protein